MHSGFYRITSQLRRLITQEHGQDLVEYALVVAVIALGATAGMKSLGSGMSGAFDQISTKLGSYVT